MRFLLALLFSLFAMQANATQQILIGGEQTTQAASTTAYNVIQGHGTWSATDTVYQIMPTAGTIDALALRPSANPAANATLTLMVNNVATSLTCTTATASICHDNSNSVSVSAGDRVSVKLVIAAGATSRAYSYNMRFTPTVDGESILLGYGSGPSSTLIDNAFENSLAWQSTGSSRAFHLIPETGTFKKLYVEVDTAPGSGTSITFTTRNAASAGNNTCTISNTATTCNDTSHTDTIAAAGDLYGVRISVSGSPTYSPVHYGIVYVSPTLGNYVYTYGSITGGLVASRPQPISGTRTNATGYLAAVSNAWTAKAIYFRLDTAPGAGNSSTITFRINGSDTALTSTISGTATTNNAATDVSVSADDRVDINPTTAGTPATSAYKVGIVANIAPANTNTGNFFLMF